MPNDRLYHLTPQDIGVQGFERNHTHDKPLQQNALS
jgi:hypothetical protein